MSFCSHAVIAPTLQTRATPFKRTVPTASRDVRSSSVAPVRTSSDRIAEFQADRDISKNFATDEFADYAPENNGDEDLFSGRTAHGRDEPLVGFASFSKTLKHDEFGIPTEKAFTSLLDAIKLGLESNNPIGNREAFNSIILGGGQKLLANPLAAFSTQLIGNDSNGARMAPAPTFGSRNTAVDMVERYWMALCRDVPFSDYATNETTLAAIKDLNALGFEDEFGFKVTPQTLFRGCYEGCDVGPHVSQYLLKDVQFGNQTISQVLKCPTERLDYMTDMSGWLEVQNGNVNLSGSDELTLNRRLTTMRDAGQWVHVDLPLQSGLYAVLLLNGLLKDKNQPTETSDANPYGRLLTTSDSFTTLGIPDVSSLACLAASYALKHAWFQKWTVHRRLRPEVYGQRLDLFLSGKLGRGGGNGATFDDGDFKRIFRDGAEVWSQTTVMDRIFEHNKTQNVDHGRGNTGTWLLPMGYPEGSPSHPAYPGGHSCFVAAAATIAKAFYKDTVLPDPVMVDAKTGELVPYEGDLLTVHGELNKLIANVTHFRDGAGMHWRTDGAPNTQPVTVHGNKLQTGGNLLGEAMAVSMLRDVKNTYREEVGVFKFKSVSGDEIVI